MPQSPVVVVSPNGPLKYPSVEAALASAHVRLEYPIYTDKSRVDTTYLRGDAYADFGSSGQLPWSYLLQRALELPEPIKTKKRVKTAGVAPPIESDG